MGRIVLTIMTCDRCQKEQRFENPPDYRGALDDPEVREFREGWATEWPAKLVPYGWTGPYPDQARRHVCTDCLTDIERQSLAQQRLAGDVPF